MICNEKPSTLQLLLIALHDHYFNSPLRNDADRRGEQMTLFSFIIEDISILGQRFRAVRFHNDAKLPLESK